MNIGDILTRSWQIIWKYKILWIFGILASCVEGGGGGGGGGNGSGYRFDGEEFNLPLDGWATEFVRSFENIENNLNQSIGVVAVILLVLCVLWLLALALGTLGRIGLVKGVLQAEQGVESLSFGDLWQDGTQHFWKVAGLWLILWLAGFVLAAILVLVVALGAVFSAGLILLCLIPLICLFIPLGWVMNLLFEQATIAMLKEELGILESLQRAWNIFRANIGNYILMALILFIIELVLGIIISVPILLVVAPALFGLMLGIDEGVRTTLIISGLCFVVYIPVFIVVGGILRAYVWTAWTLTFTRLSANLVYPPPAQPKILDAY